nr:hypothetical protein [Tanacetum cinerariifolium]
ESPLFENMLQVREVDAEEEVQVPAHDVVDQENVIEEIVDELLNLLHLYHHLLLYHLHLLTNHQEHLHHKLQRAHLFWFSKFLINALHLFLELKDWSILILLNN